MGIKGNKIKKRYLLLIFILILGAFAFGGRLMRRCQIIRR